LSAPGQALHVALELAYELTTLPQTCMRNDRLSLLAQWSESEHEAMVIEARLGRESTDSRESIEGAKRFASGAGRHGAPTPLR
jgi:enoyl-CoA hydratase